METSEFRIHFGMVYTIIYIYIYIYNYIYIYIYIYTYVIVYIYIYTITYVNNLARKINYETKTTKGNHNRNLERYTRLYKS